MKLSPFPTTLALTALLAFCTPAEALAAKGGKKAGKRQGASLAKFDKDHNGTIDSTEADALRKTYEPMASLDADKDGKLSDPEIAAAKVGKGKGGKKKGEKKKAGKKAGKKKAEGKKGKGGKRKKA